MAAIHIVRGLLAEKVEALGYKALVDQDETNPAGLDDCPGVLIEEDGAELVFLEGQNGGTVTHDGLFPLTVIGRAEGSKTARDKAYEVLVDLHRALMDDPTLGDRVQLITPTGYGGAVPQGHEIEGIGLDYTIRFCTPYNDFDTLI